MNPAPPRQELRTRKRALREALKRRRQEVRQRIEQDPYLKTQRTRRRVRRTVMVGVVALLALVSRCACAEPPPPGPVPAQEEAVLQVAKPAPKPRPKRPKKLDARTEPNDRGAYPGDPRAQTPWVDAYRLQVAARSARLAACFTGIDKPGALRWTASVNPQSGAVSDHELEALAASSPIWNKERECLIEALSRPTYQLPADAAEEGIPTRMSIVIEF